VPGLHHHSGVWWRAAGVVVGRARAPVWCRCMSVEGVARSQDRKISKKKR